MVHHPDIDFERHRAPRATTPRRLAPRRLPVLTSVLALHAAIAVLAAPVGAADLLVTTLDDIDALDGHCSLREAIVAANTDAVYRECPAGSGADVIVLEPGGVLTLGADLPPITASLTLRGQGASESEIDGAGFEVLHFADGAVGSNQILRVEALTIRGGMATEGGAIFAGRNRALEIVRCVLAGNTATVDGGAIHVDRGTSVMVEESWISGNTATESGGGLAAWDGSIEIVRSTFSGNLAQNGSGGAVYALLNDDVALRSSTFTHNSAGFEGGGVATVQSQSFHADSITVTDNRAGLDPTNDGDGGGLAFAGVMAAHLVNTILADNTDSSVAVAHCPDGSTRLGAMVVSAGFNLVGAHECLASSFPLGQPNANADQVGNLALPIDPLLEALSDFGGPTPTRLPLPGSPTIDQGSCPGAVVDQRGRGGANGLRAIDDPAVPNLADGCDIGAVEKDVWLPPMFADGFESGATEAWAETVP